MKIRAWDVTERCWIPENQLAITASGELLTYDQQEDRWAIDIICWMLCRGTGLFDLTGKEIFEGDVVKWLGYEVRENRQIRPGRWMVVGQGYVAPVVVPGNFILDCYHLQNLAGQGDKNIEVIGNIYENPELLTE
ncbi:MAG TPA: YopX family protein [Geobacteraceae bacterium]